MIECLLNRDGAELRGWSVQEWASGGSQPDALDFLHPATTQALMDRVVLAVDGQQRLTLFASFSGDQLAGSDQAFFISYTDCLSRLNSLVGGLKSSHADDGADHEVDLRMGGNPHRTRRTIH